MGTSLEKKRETWLRRPQAQDGPGTHSYQKTMYNAIKMFLDMQGIELLEGDVWGHRKDLDEYYTVDDATVEEIRTLTASGATADDVANQIEKKSGLSADLIKYIAKSKITA